jgi:hypothetical protein
MNSHGNEIKGTKIRINQDVGNIQLSRVNMVKHVVLLTLSNVTLQGASSLKGKSRSGAQVLKCHTLRLQDIKNFETVHTAYPAGERHRNDLETET